MIPEMMNSILDSLIFKKIVRGVSTMAIPVIFGVAKNYPMNMNYLGVGVASILIHKWKLFWKRREMKIGNTMQAGILDLHYRELK